MLTLARVTAAAPGAVAVIPAMPGGAFALIVGGMLWAGLWRTRQRWLGLAPIAAGALWTVAAPFPDLLVTGDGRHVAIRTPDGAVAMLRDRSGDYTQAMLAENGGVDGLPVLLAEQDFARCSADLCVAERATGARRWRILATRSAYRLDAAALIAACATADIVVSDRRLPRRCRPRWLKLDAALLAKTGGVAISLRTGAVTTVQRAYDDHPWRRLPMAASTLADDRRLRRAPDRTQSARRADQS